MGALYSYTTEVEEQQEQQEQQSRGGKRFVFVGDTSCTLECVEERKNVCEREREKCVLCAESVPCEFVMGVDCACVTQRESD